MYLTRNKNILQILSTAISFVFHPVFLPMYGVLLYFLLTPRYFLPDNIRFLIYYLLIVSLIIPLLFLWILIKTKVILNPLMKYPKERLFFSVIMATVYLIIFLKLTKYHQYIELYPFFLGIFISVTVLGIYNLWGQKPSMHTTAWAGLFVFFVIWSYYSRVQILDWLAAIVIMAALVTAARFYLQAHTTNEIIRGFIIGGLSQIIAFILTLEFF